MPGIKARALQFEGRSSGEPQATLHFMPACFSCFPVVYFGTCLPVS